MQNKIGKKARRVDKSLSEADLLARIARAQQAMAQRDAAGPHLLEPSRRPPNEKERAWMKKTIGNLREASDAEGQWRGLDVYMRRLLVYYAGVKDNSPGETLKSMAEREWSEFIRPEQKAISDVMRRLLQNLSQKTALTQKVRG
ncbi:hypothetical protein [Ottowia sp.]|uniref:hypothetical protein n=1 Tax=Ottowia sp. TaxID=1898956 RepID=UPI003A868BF2